MIPRKRLDSRDPTVDAALSFVLVPLLVVEFILLRPTVGLVRLAVHHARSPGWYVECRYGSSLERPADPRVELQTRTKGQVKRLRRALRHEFDQGADFNAPAVQSAIASNQAIFRPANAKPMP